MGICTKKTNFNTLYEKGFMNNNYDISLNRTLFICSLFFDKPNERLVNRSQKTWSLLVWLFERREPGLHAIMHVWTNLGNIAEFYVWLVFPEKQHHLQHF